MNRGRSSNLIAKTNSKLYLDLKDIIRENALQFLPAKSLFKFRSICREWKLVISTPFFAHSQANFCRSVLGFFCQALNSPPLFVSVDPNACGVPDPSLSFLPEPVEIRSSSNGLLLCLGKRDKAYYVCNPALKQYKKLPKPSADHGPKPAAVLVFEPSLLNFVAEYKVICAYLSNDFDDATEFDIYSSRSGRWETSGEICFAKLNLVPNSGVYANGIVYWRGAKILAYDIVKDRSTLLADHYHTYHHYDDHSGNVTTLGTINSQLCMSYFKSFNGNALSVRVLGNVHSNTMQMGSRSHLWRDERLVELGHVIPKDALGLSVLAISGNCVLIGNDGNLFSYDFVSKEFHTLSPVGMHRSSLWLPYVNSLASLEF